MRRKPLLPLVLAALCLVAAYALAAPSAGAAGADAESACPAPQGE